MDINLSDPNAMDQLLEGARKVLDETALRIAEGATPPRDTGFLQNSAYVNSARVNTFDRTWRSGVYGSKRGQQARQRVNAPVPYSGPNVAIVGWAAIYAWYVEDSQPFAYPSLIRAAVST